VSFPPDIVVAVKALACELPSQLGLPLSRFSMSEIRREVIQRGLVASIGETTLWRWLSEDAIRPWHHRSWIFPRDPDFASKAGRVLDLYEGLWQGEPLGPNVYVLCADEKTSIQARRRKHRTLAPAPGDPIRVEHEYVRKGAWAYLAAWDVHQARIFGRCEAKTGIRPFERLVRQVMSQQPYCSASRVFWVVDNGSSHRGPRCQRRLARRWPNLVVVHTPVHASWLNQVEIYFSVIQRKVLTPNDFNSLTALENRLLDFQAHYQAVARPFQWRFTRNHLHALLEKLAAPRRAA
jgi:DDE superfamily endonuclease